MSHVAANQHWAHLAAESNLQNQTCHRPHHIHTLKVNTILEKTLFKQHRVNEFTELPSSKVSFVHSLR